MIFIAKNNVSSVQNNVSSKSTQNNKIIKTKATTDINIKNQNLNNSKNSKKIPRYFYIIKLTKLIPLNKLVLSDLIVLIFLFLSSHRFAPFKHGFKSIKTNKDIMIFCFILIVISLYINRLIFLASLNIKIFLSYLIINAISTFLLSFLSSDHSVYTLISLFSMNSVFLFNLIAVYNIAFGGIYSFNFFKLSILYVVMMFILSYINIQHISY